MDLSCISHLHVSCALDDSTWALPVPASSGVFPGQSYRVCGHLEGACSAGREGCQGLAVRLVQEWVFSEEHKCFSTEGIRSPQHQISLLTKSHSPLASEHLTLFFRLNVEEKWCLSPVPPINPFVSELALSWRGQHAACSLATVPTASRSLTGDTGACGCPEVPYECLQW